VDDTRMFEKIGATLADSGEFEVVIIGYPSEKPPTPSNIKFHTLPFFKRLSLKRLLIPWIVFKKINQVKPELIIINTPELLLVAVLNRVFFGRKIIYDVLENYYRNIRFTPAFPLLLRPVLAIVVRFVELVTSPLLHHFLLAEKAYSQELSFATPHTVLQNKLPQSIAARHTCPPYPNFVGRRRAGKQSRGYSRLVFSGTLSASTGIFEAIRLCKHLHEIDDSFSLTIIGYCAIPEVLGKIKNEIGGSSFIALIGGDTLVPHNEILHQIGLADMGIVIYPPNLSTRSSIPTKLFEYLAVRLPILIRHNTESHQLVEKCKAGIKLEAAPEYASLSATLKSRRFTPVPPDSIFWEADARNLTNCLKLL